MKTLASKFWSLMFLVIAVVIAANIILASVQPYLPFIGIAVSVVIVAAIALLSWNLLASRKRFW